MDHIFSYPEETNENYQSFPLQPLNATKKWLKYTLPTGVVGGVAVLGEI